jgi:hypothetical protein
MITKKPEKKIKKVTEKKKEVKKTAVIKKKAKKDPKLSVSGEKMFWVNNGPILSNLEEFADALHYLSEEQFFYHTGMGRNDFSIWIGDVFDEKKCAEDLSNAKNIKEALAVIKKYI